MPDYNFAVGNPDRGSFPAADLVEAAARILPRVGEKLVLYPDQRGWEPLREIAAQRFVKNNGVDLPLENIALTAGSMQAISLVCQAYLQPGDTIIAEEFSYSGSLNCFRKFQVKVEGVAVDDDGMDPDALEETLKDLARRGVTPKLIYAIPTNQNPTGTMMPEWRRVRLLEVANRYGIPVIDDDCYADLIFEGAAPPSLYRLDPDSVIYIGSFSKILGPGARLGYFAAKDETLQKVLHWKIDGGTSNLAACIAAEYFKDNLWDHVETVNGIVKEKLAATVEQLDGHQESFVEHSNPRGGLFIWVKLPEDIDVGRLLEVANARGVRYGTGKAFHSQNQDIKYLRLAYAYATLDDIREGLPILAECVQKARGVAAVAAHGA